MSLPAQNVAPQSVAAPGQVVFGFAWRCDDSSLIRVWVNDVLDGGFTVLLNANQTAAPGGSINRAVACLGGEVVTVERASPLVQATDFTRYGPFSAATVTNLFDRMVMFVQELAATLARGVKVSRSNLTLMSSLEMPAPAAGSVLAWAAVGAQFQLASVAVATALPGGLAVFGEQLTDSGDHIHFNSVFAPTAARALYRNGQRIFSPGDYTVAGSVWTMVVPLDINLNEVLNADYAHA